MLLIQLAGKFISLLFIFFLPGYFTTLFLKQKSSFSLHISVLSTSLTGLILAQIGLFSLINLVLVLLFYSLILLIFFSFKKKEKIQQINKSIKIDRFFLALIILGLFLFSRPHQYLEGGWDPGTYLNAGINIAKTGSIKIEDKTWAKLTPAEQEIFSHTRVQKQQKYPGFIVLEGKTGLIVPRFYHLYPVWIAIFYSLFGLKGSLYVNSFFVLLSLFAFYQTVKILFNNYIARLVLLFLALSAIQIWYARFSTSEILTQYLLWESLYLLALYEEKNKSFLAFIGAITVGLALLSSLTAILILPGLALYFFYRNWVKFERSDFFFVVPFTLFLLYLGFQTVFFTGAYIKNVYWYHYQYNPAKIKVIAAVITGLGVLLILKIFSRKTKPFFDKIYQKKRFRISVGLLILLFAFYGYFIRPRLILNNFNSNNLKELALFITPLGFWLAVSGCIVLLWRGVDRKKMLFIFWTVTFSFVFLRNKVLAPSYPWALRRYVPFILPSFYILNGYLLFEISKWKKLLGKTIAVCMAAYLLISPLSRAFLLVKQTDYRGIINFSKNIAAQMKEEGIYICDGYWLATPLYFIYDKNTLSVSDQNIPKAWQVLSIMKKWLQEGENIFYITSEEKPFTPEIEFQEIASIAFQSSRLEHPLRQLPEKITKINTKVKIFKLYQVNPETPPEHGQYFIDINRNCFGLTGGFDQARDYSGGISGRWTYEEAEVVVPWPRENSEVTFTIKMSGGRPPEEKSARVSIYLDKTFIKELELSNEAQEYQFSVQSQMIKTFFPYRAILRLESTTWNPSKYGIKGYPSYLGVLLDWIKVEF